MNSYRAWKKKTNEATASPVTDDPNQTDDTEPSEDDKLFYKGQYSGVVGPLIARLGGIVMTDSRFKRPAVKGLLLQDIILALGLNNDVGMFNRIATKLRNNITTAENPSGLHFGSPTLQKAMKRKGLLKDSPRPPQAPPQAPPEAPPTQPS